MITLEQLPLVAIPEMNDIHFEEIELINKLEKAARSLEPVIVIEALQEFLEHTTAHFAKEEEMMQAVNYPDFNPHKAEHDRHLKEIASSIRYVKENQAPKAVSAYVEGSLAPWVKHHIGTMDTQAALFIQEHTTR